VYITGRCNALHDVTSSAVSTDRQSAADDFSEACEVRGNSVMALGAVIPYPEACHDFIEDQESAVVLCNLADKIKIAFHRRNDSHVAGNRLHEHRCYVCAELVESFFQALFIIVWNRECVGGRTFRHTRRIREAERRHSTASFYEKRVAVAVIAPLEFEDLPASGEPSRKPQCCKGCFGAR